MNMIDLGTLGLDLILDTDGWHTGFTQANEDIEEHQTRWQSFANNMSGKIKTAITGAIIAIGVAFVGLASAGMKTADELQKSLNQLQASTGSTDKEMKELHNTMLNIYKNNFGESFEDIANAMEKVKQVTGMTGKALEETTQNALMLRDVFEFEVNESVNAANTMMKNFSITSKQAYTLIAQGAQQGANKNDDLIDTLNEYAPQFKALGFSAEQFTNVLITGAKGGAFSVDKLGDAVKEFNIRAKDGSDSTIEAFESLGLKANILTKKFAMGGEEARKSFDEVIEKLANVDDKVKQNALGVALFGTQWEDLGSDAIISLANIRNSIDMTGNTLEKINKVKYNSVGEAIEGITRKIEVSLMPVFDKITGWINDNMDEVTEAIGVLTTIIEGLSIVLGFLASNLEYIIPIIFVFLSAWAGYKLASLIDGISTAFGGITTMLGGMNPVMLKTVGIIMLVVGALVALGAIIATIQGRGKELRGTFESIGNISQNSARHNMPRYATGTNYVTHDQVAVVHKGEAIVPEQDNPFNPNATRNGLGESGGNTYNITIPAKDIKEFNNIVEIANDVERKSRKR